VYRYSVSSLIAHGIMITESHCIILSYRRLGCEILGSHSSKYEDECLQGYYTI
jgi:hypothetical protein